jgi:UDP-2,3-diacylglucosamine pyrophosphatase LpxH
LRDLIIVSDLHIGQGRNPQSGRFHALENFFADEDFLTFCRHLTNEAAIRGAPFTFLLNGDTFDFLRVDTQEIAGEDLPGAEKAGPTLTEEQAAAVMRRMLAGHPVFLDGLAHVLDAGHQVVFLPGNHDLELQWPAVQEEIRSALLARPSALMAHAIPARAERLRFEPWFYYEEGRIWVEHGCQYDAECSFRFHLRGSASRNAVRSLDGDMPLGNFFQRYLYNAFGPITFIVPSTRANFRYFKWMLANRPRLLARVMLRHGPFSLRLLRRLSQHAGNDPTLEAAHRRELGELAESSGLGPKLHKVEQLKVVPPNLALATRAFLLPAVRLAGSAVLGGFALAAVWFWSFSAVSHLQVGLGFRTLLFLMLQFLMLVILVSGLAWLGLSSLPSVPPRPLRRAAQRISSVLDVPLVTFGHTHDEAVWRLPREGGPSSWYFNTGTWISVFTHEDLLPRERVQLTFLRVRESTGELLQWSPGRGAPAPVILLDEAHAHVKALVGPA